MGDTEFREHVIEALAALQTNVKWVVRIGGTALLLAIGTVAFYSQAHTILAENVAHATTQIEAHIEASK